jgi:purine-nucleoside phosphorylase
MLTLLLSFDPPLSGPQFLDLSEPFDAEMRKKVREVLVQEGLSFQEGTYCYIHGPNFETPADKMALKALGADVVGMSTVPETMMARWLGVRVLGLSFVTNLAFVTHAHEDVLAAAESGSEGMAKVINGILKKLM